MKQKAIGSGVNGSSSLVAFELLDWSLEMIIFELYLMTSVWNSDLIDSNDILNDIQFW